MRFCLGDGQQEFLVGLCYVGMSARRMKYFILKRENASDKVVSGFCSESDWLRKRHEVSGSITEHSI